MAFCAAEVDGVILPFFLPCFDGLWYGMGESIVVATEATQEKGENGDGGNRTPVREVSAKAFYMISR